MPSTPFLPAAVQAALDQGNRLEAVRLLRERYALGLRESMEVIAGIRRLPGAGLSGQEPRSATQDLQPRRAQGHVHAQTSAPTTTYTQPHAPPELATSVVNALKALIASKLPPATPQQPAEALFREGLAPGEVPRGSGGSVLVVLVVLALIGSYVLFR